MKVSSRCRSSQLIACRKMPLENEDVVAEAEFLERRNSAIEVRPQHEVVVRLVLEDVANGFQFRPARQSLQLAAQPGGTKRNPPHHAMDEVIDLGQFEQPLEFPPGFGGPGRSRRPRCRLPAAISRLLRSAAEIPPENRHRPWKSTAILGKWIARPEMVVGIDGHGAAQTIEWKVSKAMSHSRQIESINAVLRRAQQ